MAADFTLSNAVYKINAFASGVYSQSFTFAAGRRIVFFARSDSPSITSVVGSVTGAYSQIETPTGTWGAFMAPSNSSAGTETITITLGAANNICVIFAGVLTGSDNSLSDIAVLTGTSAPDPKVFADALTIPSNGVGVAICEGDASTNITANNGTEIGEVSANHGSLDHVYAMLKYTATATPSFNTGQNNWRFGRGWAFGAASGTGLTIADCTSAGLATSITLNANPQVAANNALSAGLVSNLTLTPAQPIPAADVISTAFSGNDSPGTEYVQNGAFNDASFWSLGTSPGTNISAGKAQIPSGAANSFEVKQNNALPAAGRWIKVQYTIGKWQGAPVAGGVRFRADSGAFGLDAPVLTPTAPAATSLGWSSRYDNTVPWDPEENSGDQIELEWRVNGGAWQTDTRQPLTSLVLAQFPTPVTWPLFNAATFTSGQTVEVRERKFRYVANSVVGNSPYSNVLLFTKP